MIKELLLVLLIGSGFAIIGLLVGSWFDFYVPW